MELRTCLSLPLLILLILSFSCKNNDGDDEPLVYEIEDDLITLTTLNDDLFESSGLLLNNGILWTINDSGNDPILYSILESGSEIQESVSITNAINVDWEDMARDETNFYIGDFGNNGGERTDLTIYSIPHSNLPENTAADIIFFSFSDQSIFENANSMHDFDCEAMVSVGDHIYIFSKNHIDKKTKLYTLSKSLGFQSAQLTDEFETDGLITGAGIDKTTNTLCLLGYNPNDTNFDPFVWIFYDYNGVDFFNGKSKRVNLPIQAQTEAICYKGDGKFLISSEDENGVAAQLYLFDAEKWKE